ncbi:MAG: hypothetical protein AAGI11_20000 [Pseudomonadota bacterium]
MGKLITNTRVSVALRGSAVLAFPPRQRLDGDGTPMQPAVNDRITGVGQRLRVLNVSRYHMTDPRIVLIRRPKVNRESIRTATKK